MQQLFDLTPTSTLNMSIKKSPLSCSNILPGTKLSDRQASCINLCSPKVFTVQGTSREKFKEIKMDGSEALFFLQDFRNAVQQASIFRD